MTNSLGALLTAKLQDRGIYPNDYDELSLAVYCSLDEIDSQVLKGESISMPVGNEYKKMTSFRNIKVAA